MNAARRALALGGWAVLAAVSLPGSGSAQSEDLLECSTQAVTPAFRDKLADSMLADDQAGEGLSEQLATISDECAGRYGLSDDQRDAYFTYSLARLPRDALITRLGALGISAQVIDDALDFGTGRSNPQITGRLQKPQIDKLLAALTAAGVDVAAIADQSWTMIGAYAAASSLMWQNRARLR